MPSVWVCPPKLLARRVMRSTPPNCALMTCWMKSTASATSHLKRVNAPMTRSTNLTAGPLEGTQMKVTLDDAYRPATVEVELGGPRSFGMCVLTEHIAEGQRIERYSLAARVDGDWQTIADGTTIGHKKIDRFAPVTGDAVRLRVEASRGRPMIRALSLFAGA